MDYFVVTVSEQYDELIDNDIDKFHFMVNAIDLREAQEKAEKYAVEYFTEHSYKVKSVQQINNNDFEVLRKFFLVIN